MAELESSLGKRKNDLPEGYVCKACGKGGHPIYECENYKKKTKGDLAPKKVKIFISGLNYELTNESLTKFLQDNGCNFDMTVSVAKDKVLFLYILK